MKVSKIICILRIVGKEDVFTCISNTMFNTASKLVALIVYKSLGVMAPSFICPNNNHYHQHGIGSQRLRPYKERDFTSISRFIVKNP
jgi:hypothetical protein